MLLTNITSRSLGLNSLDNKYTFVHENHLVNESYGISLYLTERERRNYLQFSDNNWIASCGFHTYKHLVGKNSINKIRDEGVYRDVKIREKEIVGNYCIIVRDDDGVSIFTDKYSIYKIYYYINDNIWAISNSLALLSLIVPELSINEFGIIQSCFQYGILGRETIFKQIHKLRSAEYIIIQSTGLPQICREGKIKQQTIHETSTEEFCNILQTSISPILSAIDGKIGLFITGGLDSRLVLAAMTSLGHSPTLFYAVGNDPIVGTKEKDREIVEEISRKLNLELVVMSWDFDNSEKPDYQSKWKNAFNRYGFDSRLYGSGNFHEAISQDIPDQVSFVDFGYFGERMRNVPWLDTLTREYFTLDEFVREFYINKNLKAAYQNFDSFYDYLLEEFKSYAEELKLPNRIPKESFQIIHDQYRINADTYMVNYLNKSKNSMILFSTCEFYDYIHSIPYELKKNARLIISSIEKMNPVLTKIPLFSRNRKQIIKKGEMKRAFGWMLLLDSLNNIGLNEKSSLVKMALIFSRKISDMLFQRSKTLDTLNQSSHIKRDFVKIVDEYQTRYKKIIDPHAYEGYIVPLMYYTQSLVCIDQLSVLREEFGNNAVRSE